MEKLSRYILISLTLLLSFATHAKIHTIPLNGNTSNLVKINIIVGDTLIFENTSIDSYSQLFFGRSSSTQGNSPLFNSEIINPGNFFEKTFTTPDVFIYYSDERLANQLGQIQIFEKPLLISPRDGIILGKKDFSFTVFYNLMPSLPVMTPPMSAPNSLERHISLIFDKKVIYDGDFYTFLRSAFVSEAGEIDNSSFRYFVITVPKNSFSLGRHTLQIKSNDSTILYDEVSFTVR